MALTPIDESHALQIQAGTIGRKAGHAFEDRITECINSISFPINFESLSVRHLQIGEPGLVLLKYVASTYSQNTIVNAVALSTGALATSEEGKKWLEINGVRVSRCKSDLILTVRFPDMSEDVTIGVSTKQCNNNTPTNAQLYFTTARGFANLLTSNDMPVSDYAVKSLRQFCGDSGFRPSDDIGLSKDRKIDPRRFFWEETESVGRLEWELLFQTKQDEVTRLLLQKAYLDDPFAPDMILHKTRKSTSWETTESAIYTIDELISHSRHYGGFSLKPYSVRKGSYKDPVGISHQAPRFGIVQMQRGGQAQHPEQLQFNLEAGYFYKIAQNRPNVLSDSSGK